jgi:hypothetical protein
MSLTIFLSYSYYIEPLDFIKEILPEETMNSFIQKANSILRKIKNTIG